MKESKHIIMIKDGPQFTSKCWPVDSKVFTAKHKLDATHCTLVVHKIYLLSETTPSVSCYAPVIIQTIHTYFVK